MVLGDKDKIIAELFDEAVGFLDSVLRCGLSTIDIDKRVYPHNLFLISQQKHMLWVLIRSASLRHF